MNKFHMIRPGGLEAILWLIPDWQMINFHMNPAWSSRSNSSIDFYLKIDQIAYESSLELSRQSLIDSQLKNNKMSCESSLELSRPFFNWFIIEKWSNSHIKIIWGQKSLKSFMFHWKLIWKTNYIVIQQQEAMILTWQIIGNLLISLDDTNTSWFGNGSK